MQQLPPQLDDLRYHHHPQYTTSAPYHQSPATTGEGRIIFKMFSSSNKHEMLQGVLLSPGWALYSIGYYAATFYAVSQQVIKVFSVVRLGYCRSIFTCFVNRMTVKITT
jgi:hypothetical protein